jgi:hypothetical protein
MPYFRSDMALITLGVDGKTYGDAWFSYEGGDLENDDSKTRPGGMGREVSIGGPGSRSDITLQTQMTDVVIGWHNELEQKCIEDAPAVAGLSFLDRLKAPTGEGFTRRGTIKSAKLPDMDGGSSDPAMYTVVISCDE